MIADELLGCFVPRSHDCKRSAARLAPPSLPHARSRTARISERISSRKRSSARPFSTCAHGGGDASGARERRGLRPAHAAHGVRVAAEGADRARREADVPSADRLVNAARREDVPRARHGSPHRRERARRFTRFGRSFYSFRLIVLVVLVVLGFLVVLTISAKSKTGNSFTLYRAGEHVDISGGPMVGDTSFLGRRCTIASCHKIDYDNVQLYRFQGVALPKGVFLSHYAFGILEKRASRLNDANLHSAKSVTQKFYKDIQPYATQGNQVCFHGAF